MIETKKFNKLVDNYIKVKTALDTLKEQEKLLKEAIYPYVDEEENGKFETAKAKLAILPGRLNRKVNYEGLKGYSEDVYNRFVTESHSAPTLRITVKK